MVKFFFGYILYSTCFCRLTFLPLPNDCGLNISGDHSSSSSSNNSSSSSSNNSSSSTKQFSLRSSPQKGPL